jgi:hypothetical protein
MFLEGVIGEGVIGVVAPSVVLGSAIWGFFSTGGSLAWVIQIGQAAVSSAGSALLTALHLGMAAILGSLVSVNPWVRFALDLFQVAVDIAYLVIGAFSVFKAIMARGGSNLSFFQKLGLILQKINAGQLSGVFGLALTALGGFVGTTVAVAVFLMLDATAAVRDLQVAMRSR